LLSEAVALLGFCERSGSGIDLVYEEAVASGHDFPYFDGDSEAFSAIVPLQRDTNFAKFIRYRAKEFTRLESLLIIKHLQKVGEAGVSELSGVVQRPTEFTETVLRDLAGRLVLKKENSQFSLSEPVRHEIEHPLDRDQRTLFDRPV
jgi:predicted HTH transcriptional regulator